MPPTPPKTPFNWRRLSKTLSFWVLVILVPVAVIQMSGARGEPSVEMDYSEYREQLEAKYAALHAA